MSLGLAWTPSPPELGRAVSSDRTSSTHVQPPVEKVLRGGVVDDKDFSHERVLSTTRTSVTKVLSTSTIFFFLRVKLNWSWRVSRDFMLQRKEQLGTDGCIIEGSVLFCVSISQGTQHGQCQMDLCPSQQH